MKPNRAPPNSSRSAETPIPNAGYGQQHRQIDRSLSNTPISTGFSVGQVIDPKILQQQQFVYSNGMDGGNSNDVSDGYHRNQSKSNSNSREVDRSPPEGDPYEYNYYSNNVDSNEDDFVNGNNQNPDSNNNVDQYNRSPQTSPGMNPQRVMRSSAPVEGKTAWLGKGGVNDLDRRRNKSPNSNQRNSDPISSGHHDSSKRPVSPQSVQALASQPGSAAMLEAARSSQSRRR